jgi:predicted Zn finger-like uncharacterized protein
MKVVCDACGMKYSIDDSRITGRAFKIRCKQCAHVLLVRGRAPTAEPAPAGTWFAVLDGTSRPIELAELRRRRAAGEIGDRTLVWREGLDDWCELGSVDELRPAVPALETSGAEPTEVSSVLPPAAAAGSPIVIGEIEAAPGSSAAARKAEPAAAVHGPTLRHQRNESSVLFSLREIARIAEPPRAAATPVIEGSGLIDIRSIARKIAPARPEPSAPDVPLFGPVTLEPAVLVPRRPGSDRRLLWALAASVGALAVVTTVLLLVVLRSRGPARPEGLPSAKLAPIARSAPPEASPAQPAPGTAPTLVRMAPAAPGTPATVTTAPASVPTGHGTPATVTTAPVSPAAHAHAHAADAATPGSSPAATAPAAHVAAADRASARTPSASQVSPGGSPPPQLSPHPAAEACSEVTCLVNGYADKCCEIYRQAAALPEKLDRQAVAAGLAGIDASECRGKSSAHGDVAVSVKVSPAGAVTGVTVKSSPDPALSTCVTEVVQLATFARTQRGGAFAYTWRL